VISRRLEELGIELPALAPRGNYSIGRAVGSTLYVSGQGPIGDGVTLRGTVGKDVSLDEAKAGARTAAIHLLAAASEALGGIDRVRSVLNLTVYVRASAGFTDHSVVADGCSDLFAEVFGDEGLAARAAIGVSSLPFDLALEATAVFEIEPA
jgi:enamine deaminase RidA (YjgF/YER057c/UK114 family)